MTAISNDITKLNKSCGESIDNSKPVQIPEAMSPGDMLPQGDIALLMLDSLPPDWEEFNWPKEGDMQLAPGNTRGSRHMIPREFADSVKLYRISDGDPLSDIGLRADAPFNLTHPEHADHIGYPPGIYRVRHQQNSQRERVID